MDIILNIFTKCYDYLTYVKRNTMHKRKGIRISNVVHLFLHRGWKHTEETVYQLTISRQVARAVKLNGVVLGWANHRANRLVDLATLTFRFREASAIAQGRRVECVALFWLHRCATQIKDTKKVPRFGFPRNNFKE